LYRKKDRVISDHWIPRPEVFQLVEKDHIRKMALQGLMSFEGIKHSRFSSIHRRPKSLDGDQLGHHHFVGVKSPIHELPAKMEERIWPNHKSNCKEEQQQQLRKPVWDCESSLYDSFELSTFSQQLNRAIAAASTPSSLMNNHHLIGGIRSLSLPHYVSTKSTTTSTEYQYSPLKVVKEEISVQEEKLKSKVVEGNTNQIRIHDRHQTVSQNEVEHKLDTRQILKSQNKRMGFTVSVQRLFTRLFHKKAASCKPKMKMEAEADDQYYNHHSRGLSIHRSEFDPKVRKTASKRIIQESLRCLMCRETVGY